MSQERDDKVYRFGDDNLLSNVITKNELRDCYDRFHEKSEFVYYHNKTTRKFLTVLLRKARVRAGSSVLDVGCAVGFYTEQMRRLGFQSVGLDISRVGILRGREKYPASLFFVGDAADMPINDRSFDAIFMLGCSLTNTRDIQAIQIYLNRLMKFVRDDTMEF
ncbi:MAG TPA: class I SAM-dependent methyltransferase [Candidatus Kryptonia bacterium]